MEECRDDRDCFDFKIERNARISKILSIIAIVSSLITLITYICMRGASDKNSFKFTFYSLLVSIPVCYLGISKTTMTAINKLINPITSYITGIVVSFIPYVMSILLCIVYAAIGLRVNTEWAYYCGYMLPSHIWLFVADGFLIHSCILIKRKWKNSPPDFIFEKNERIKHKKEEQISAKNTKQYQDLIDRCGIRFFIKYYNQIKRLPLRDVLIVENYSPIEREERLVAAKQIIDSNLAEFALREIINSYSDVLDNGELEQAKSILADLENNNR